MTPKNTICLWYDHDALDAATFYAATFPDSAVGRVMRAPGDSPSGRQGDILTVEFAGDHIGDEAIADGDEVQPRRIQRIQEHSRIAGQTPAFASIVDLRGAVTVFLHHPEVPDQVFVLSQNRRTLWLVLVQPCLRPR